MRAHCLGESQTEQPTLQRAAVCHSSLGGHFLVQGFPLSLSTLSFSHDFDRRAPGRDPLLLLHQPLSVPRTELWPRLPFVQLNNDFTLLFQSCFHRWLLLVLFCPESVFFIPLHCDCDNYYNNCYGCLTDPVPSPSLTTSSSYSSLSQPLDLRLPVLVSSLIGGTTPSATTQVRSSFLSLHAQPTI